VPKLATGRERQAFLALSRICSSRQIREGPIDSKEHGRCVRRQLATQFATQFGQFSGRVTEAASRTFARFPDLGVDGSTFFQDFFAKHFYLGGRIDPQSHRPSLNADYLNGRLDAGQDDALI
jgi:hypothetical protein